MKSGIIFDIKRFAVHDGPGIRTTIFFKGCPLECLWCHNPESIFPHIQTVNKTTKVGTKEFVKAIEIGRRITVENLLIEIKKDTVFYQNSNGGVTFSGGEALAQPEFLLQILKRCKAEKIHTTLDTCGFCTLHTLQNLLPYTDLFLYDVKFINEDLHKKYTGVSNAQIIENLVFLIKNKAKINIRIPLIPSITDTNENIAQIILFLKKINFSQKITLLPYHGTAESKYKHYTNRIFFSVKPQKKETLFALKNRFLEAKLSAEINE